MHYLLLVSLMVLRVVNPGAVIHSRSLLVLVPGLAISVTQVCGEVHGSGSPVGRLTLAPPRINASASST
jgi:hypothetical protein